MENLEAVNLIENENYEYFSDSWDEENDDNVFSPLHTQQKKVDFAINLKITFQDLAYKWALPLFQNLKVDDIIQLLE